MDVLRFILNDTLVFTLLLKLKFGENRRNRTKESIGFLNCILPIPVLL